MDTSLQQRIQSADLTRTEKRIADYFLDHSESLYFMTARDIAQELGVSDTSIIRLCRTLGYRGFRELQESQRAELAQVMESGRYVIPRQQVEGKLEQYQNCSPFQCLQLAMETLQETYRKNRPEKFERAAQLLLQSEHIFISGFRGFSGSARYMGVLLSQYINRVTYYCDADTRCVEGLIDYGSQDCVVVFRRGALLPHVLRAGPDRPGRPLPSDRYHRQAHRTSGRGGGHRAAGGFHQSHRRQLLSGCELSGGGHRLRGQPPAGRLSPAAAVPHGPLPVGAASILMRAQK